MGFFQKGPGSGEALCTMGASRRRSPPSRGRASFALLALRLAQHSLSACEMRFAALRLLGVVAALGVAAANVEILDDASFEELVASGGAWRGARRG